jgi:hypothetical protein
MGVLGGAFGSGYRNIINYNSNGFSYLPNSINYNPGYQMAIALISAAIGIGFGLIAGLLILIVNRQQTNEHFTDVTYWVNDDGITTEMKKRISI